MGPESGAKMLGNDGGVDRSVGVVRRGELVAASVLWTSVLTVEHNVTQSQITY